MRTKQIKSKKKSRFDVHQFDHETFVVFDQIEQREICVCSNYDDWNDAEEKAKNIVNLLNANVSYDEETLG